MLSCRSCCQRSGFVVVHAMRTPATVIPAAVKLQALYATVTADDGLEDDDEDEVIEALADALQTAHII